MINREKWTMIILPKYKNFFCVFKRAIIKFIFYSIVQSHISIAEDEAL